MPRFKGFFSRLVLQASAVCSVALPAVSAVHARTADWQPLAISADHSSWMFLDQSSIVHKGKKVSVRVLLEYDQPQAGLPETNEVPYRRVLNLMSFNCADKSLLVLQEEYLDGEQQLLGQADVSSATWDPVLPESLIEPVFDAVCGRSLPQPEGGPAPEEQSAD